MSLQSRPVCKDEEEKSSSLNERPPLDLKQKHKMWPPFFLLYPFLFMLCPFCAIKQEEKEKKTICFPFLYFAFCIFEHTTLRAVVSVCVYT